MSDVNAVGTPVVYVSGPYSSDPEENTVRAIEVADVLAKAGYAPIVPHLAHFWDKQIPGDYEQWMKIDLAHVRKCDILVRIEGESEGADREVELAKELGIPVVFTGWNTGKENRDTRGCIIRRVGRAWIKILERRNLERRQFVETPKLAPQKEIEPAVAKALDTIANIFRKKNADYANAESWRSNFLDVAKQQGITDLDACDTLIAVKQARLRSLRANGAKPKNEAVEDTYLDRATYAVIALAMLIEDQEAQQ